MRSLVGCVLLALLLPGCSSPSGPASFDPAAQQDLIRERQRRELARARPPEPAPQTVRERLRHGDALRSDGEYAAAMWSYLQAHELDPADPEPVARMGSLHLLLDPDRAEAILRDLVERHPGSAAAHTGLGLVLIEREDFTAARATLERAIELNDRSVTAHSALGACLDRAGEHRAAQAAYTRAIGLRPDLYEALNNLGVSRLATGDFESAVEALRRASMLEERDPAVFNNLGLALGRMGRHEAALAAFRRAGSEQAARNNLGYVSYLNGDYERAIAEYERALLADGADRLLVLRNLRAAKRESDSSGPIAGSDPSR